MATETCIIIEGKVIEQPRKYATYERYPHPLPKHYTICCHPLDLLNNDWTQIGSGVYGRIWACTTKNGGPQEYPPSTKRRNTLKHVAVKAEGSVQQEIELGEIVSPSCSDDVYPILHDSTLREIAITRRLPATHPNIALPHLVIYSTRNVPYLIMPLAQTNLTKMMCQRPINPNTRLAIPVSIKAIAHCLHSICTGLDYLHSNGVCHNDIHPDNVLIFCDDGCLDMENPNIRYALSDFGISCTRTMKRLVKPPFVSRATMASPELIASKLDIYYTGRLANLFAIDMWAVGSIGMRLILDDLLPWEEAACAYGHATIFTKYKSEIEPTRLALLIAMCEFFDQATTFRFGVYARNEQNVWNMDQKLLNDATAAVQRKRANTYQIDPIDVISRRRKACSDKYIDTSDCRSFWKEILSKMLDFDANLRLNAADTCKAIVHHHFYDIGPMYNNNQLHALPQVSLQPLLPNIESSRPFLAMTIKKDSSSLVNIPVLDKLLCTMLGYFFNSWTFDRETMLLIYCTEILRSAELFCLYAYASFTRTHHVVSCMCGQCMTYHITRLACIMCIVTKIQMHHSYGIERASHMAAYAYRRCAGMTINKEQSKYQFYMNAIPSQIRQIALDLDGEFDMSFPSERAISRLLIACDLRSSHVDKPLYIKEGNTELRSSAALNASVIGMSLCISMAPDFLSSKQERRNIVDFCTNMSSISSISYLQQMWDDTILESSTNPYLTSPKTASIANTVRNNLLKLHHECANIPKSGNSRESVLTIILNMLGIIVH